MGLFPINGSTIGKALAITPNNTIDARSAWLFENQTGTLGTNLNSSVLYVGVTGDINCILSGVVGVQGTVTALDATDPYGSNPSYNALSNGSGYATANGLLTSVTSTVPKSPAKPISAYPVFNLAFLAPIRISQASASESPAPTAAPFIKAIVGFGI